MEKPRILILGAGLVGSEIARCLSKLCAVTVVDRNPEALPTIQHNGDGNYLIPVCADFLDERCMQKLAEANDVVVGAIEPSIAYEVLSRIAAARKPIVDISFYQESPLSLDPIAKNFGIPIAVDCGVMPGLGNMLLGQEMTKMQVDKFVCQCGGLPANPESPWYYKAPFAPRSVIDLYTRKAVIVSNGVRLEVDPLATTEKVRLAEYPELGTLVAIKSDGLRTLVETTRVPNMVDQSLRYPKHMRIVRDFVRSGFLSENPVSVKDCDGNYVNVVPRVFSERILADAWKLKVNEDEFTVFVVKIEGTIRGEKKIVTYHTLERRDPVTRATSMSRMTGYPCAAVALLLAAKVISKPGVVTPEAIGMEEQQMQFVLNFMRERGILLSRTEEVLL